MYDEKADPTYFLVQTWSNRGGDKGGDKGGIPQIRIIAMVSKKLP